MKFVFEYFKRYIFGGTDQIKIFNDLWEFDFKLKSWKEIKIKENISPRCGHLSFISNEKEMIILGGLSDKELTKEILFFNGKQCTSIPYESIFTNFDNEESIDLIPGIIHSSSFLKDSNLYLYG